MEVRRLTWAGAEVTAGDTSLVIDYMGGIEAFQRWLGRQSEPFVAPAAGPGQVAAALVTHSHPDHFDGDALGRVLAPGAPVLCPAGMASAVEQAGLRAQGMSAWQHTELGPFAVTAVPAVDGVADAQVSWVVQHDGSRLIHCGDTMFHGAWWPIRERSGPIDVALLPINGAIVDFPHVQPATGLPATMTPEQAAAAAQVLRARIAVPMHYGLFHHPPHYVSAPDPEPAFSAAAHRRGVEVRVLRPGEALELRAAAPA